MVEGTKEGSVITEEMVAAFAQHENISLEDGSQKPGVVGSLVDLENGHGNWPEWMKEEGHGNTFATLALARKNALEAKLAELA